jgi:CheY-like chemotaxis protein
MMRPLDIALDDRAHRKVRGVPGRAHDPPTLAQEGPRSQMPGERKLTIMPHEAWTSPFRASDAESLRTVRRVRVFLAEDDAQLRRLLAAVLREDGYDVVECADGSELLDRLASCLLEEGPPEPPDLDVIVADVSMPGCRGIDVLAGLRKAAWRTPVILLSACSEPRARARARRLGATAFLPKPIDLAVLLRALEDLC